MLLTIVLIIVIVIILFLIFILIKNIFRNEDEEEGVSGLIKGIADCCKRIIHK